MKRILLAAIIFAILALSLTSCTTPSNEKNEYTVSFNARGGSEIEPQVIEEGQTATRPTDPTKSGYTFLHWTLDGKEFNFDTPIVSDITLVAVYKSTLSYSSLIDLWRGVETVNGSSYDYSLEINDSGTGTLLYSKAGADSDAISPTVSNLRVENGYLLINYSDTALGTTSLEFVDGRLVGVGLNGGTLTLERQNTVSVTYHHYGGGTSIERYAVGDSFRSISCALPSGMVFDCWYTSDGTPVSEDSKVNKSFSVYANAYTEGLQFDKNRLTAYTGDSTDVIIPEYIAGERITEIGDSAFLNSEIISISLPDGLTSIGNAAFRGCAQLEYIEIPNEVKTIGDYALYNCTSIRKLVIPDGVTSLGFASLGADLSPTVLENGEVAILSTNTSLYSLSLPFVGGSIDGENAFIGYLFGARAPEDNWYESEGKEYELDGEAGVATMYYYLPVTLSTVTVRNLEIIPEKAFYSCLYLENIELEGAVSEVGDSAFEKCYNASISGTEMLRIIGDRAFLSTEFDGGRFHMLEKIGEFALAYTKITEVFLPETLTEIGEGAFAFTGLSTITFPASLEVVGSGAFYGCNELTEATFLGEIAPKIESDIFTSIEDDKVYYTDLLIWVPGTAAAGQPYESYRADLYLRSYAASIFPESLRGASGYTVDGDRLIGYLKASGEEMPEILKVPAGVKKISNFAFYNRVSITEIYMPDGFEVIGKYAFYGCTSVAYLDIPSTLKEIDDYAFTGFFVGNNITRLYFPEGFRRIGEGAFMSSFNLRIVELPSTLEYVGYLAFGMSNSLERIYFSSPTPPTVGEYVVDDEERSCEIFQIINTGSLTVYVPYGFAGAYKNADGFSNVRDYIKAKPEGTEVGHYGNGKWFVDLDGCDGITISTLVLADEDTSGMGGTRYVYRTVNGRYTIDRLQITIETEEYGTIVGFYIAESRQLILPLESGTETLEEPKYYYDAYNWTNFKLYTDGSGVFDMYGSFITPFKWEINGSVFSLTIDGNNKLPENAELAGEKTYFGSYDALNDSFKIEFMLNDYSIEYFAESNPVNIAVGEVTRLYGKYVAYSDGGYAMLTIISYGNGVCDFYIGENIYTGCAYTIKDGIITVYLTILEVELKIDNNGRLEGGEGLVGESVVFVYEDELMDSTKMPD